MVLLEISPYGIYQKSQPPTGSPVGGPDFYSGFVLRVADSKTMNRNRVIYFFIIEGDCLRRLVRIIWSSVR